MKKSDRNRTPAGRISQLTQLRPFRPGTVYRIKFASWKETVPVLLGCSGLPARLQDVETILLKPNLVEALPPPITTPVELVEAVVDYIQGISNSRIIIGEGAGAIKYDTWHVFRHLGYMDLAGRKGVELLDLNEQECTKLSCPGYRRWSEMYLPKIALESFLISIPVLKAHTLAGVTLTMKNMMGLAPPSHYRHGNSWQKSAFHAGIQEAIADLNRYRAPDFTILDATVGMAEAHLHGPECDPPRSVLAAGYDPVAIDAYGAGLLDKDWRKIGHIRSVHNELGRAEPLHVHNLEASSGQAKIV